MDPLPINEVARHERFLASTRRHVLIIKSDGIHQWQITPGLPDTGGQNVFVNQFSQALANLGFRITIANRGGYPHPQTGELHRGLRYKDDHQRILYLEDGLAEFVRKEEMGPRITALVLNLRDHLTREGSTLDFIFSHYWDGARIGMLLNRELPRAVPHIWVPYSLGTIKQHQVRAEEQLHLHLEERINLEQSIIREVNGVAAPSTAIRHALQHDYNYVTSLFLPPCVDTARFHPREIAPTDPIWRFLSDHAGLPPERVRECRIVTEISRTDTTKRKDVLIRAFARAHKLVPACLLVISIDDSEQPLAGQLRRLIDSLGIRRHTAIVGTVASQLPYIYAVSSIYCTPSILEGFGTSVQEAAAAGVPAIASDRVPFAVEYLLSRDYEERELGGSADPVRLGAGAIVVKSDDVDGFAGALELLLGDDELRKKMGDRAHRITLPYFTWERTVKLFLNRAGIEPGAH